MLSFQAASQTQTRTQVSIFFPPSSLIHDQSCLAEQDSSALRPDQKQDSIMEGPFSLLEYLQQAPPALPLEPPPDPGSSTTDSEYSATDISTIGIWSDFDLQSILQRYNQILTQAQLPRLDLAPPSPPISINAKFTLIARLYEYVAPREVLEPLSRLWTIQRG
ncbi:uncharacterized protein BDV14DRAFT_84313 [Aspergillus stella-maris]|uniref:uncharacterized protein n=1 Tax=Aspergillus stella-maris TaxID=1810926 RepID=UPI003CCD3BD0